jgi:phage shock protein PspC (stress-responsive transcriptional regulator)
MTSTPLAPTSSDGGPLTSDAPSPLPGAAVPGTDLLRPPLRRSTTDTVLSGVCGGLAEHTGVEAMLWRIGFIALTLMGPGIPLYLLLWLLVPAGPGVPAALDGTGRLNRLRKGLTPSR